MITIQADFNHLDGQGRLLLSDLLVHETTPFAELATSGERIVFIHGEDVVEGSLVLDEHLGWVGVADWETQGILRSFPEGVRAIA